MHPRVEQDASAGAHRVELPALARSRVAPVSHEQVQVPQRPELARLGAAQESGDRGQVAVVVAHEARSLDRPRECLELACIGRVDPQRLLHQDRPPRPQQVPRDDDRQIVGQRDHRAVVILHRDLLECTVVGDGRVPSRLGLGLGDRVDRRDQPRALDALQRPRALAPDQA